MKFSEWKTITIARLIEIKRRHEDNPKIVNDVNAILSKLHYAKVRDLSTILLYLHHASVDLKEFLELIPSKEEIMEWFKEEA